MRLKYILLLFLLLSILSVFGFYVYRSIILPSNMVSVSEDKNFSQTINNTNQISETQIKQITLDEVSKHKSKNDCWLIVNGLVYDMTKFIPNHPGGNDIIKGCGTDATQLFNKERDHAKENASTYLPEYLIGKISK